MVARRAIVVNDQNLAMAQMMSKDTCSYTAGRIHFSFPGSEEFVGDMENSEGSLTANLE